MSRSCNSLYERDISVLNVTFCGNQFRPKAFGKAIHFDFDFEFLNGSHALYTGV